MVATDVLKEPLLWGRLFVVGLSGTSQGRQSRLHGLAQVKDGWRLRTLPTFTQRSPRSPWESGPGSQVNLHEDKTHLSRLVIEVLCAGHSLLRWHRVGMFAEPLRASRWY